MPINSHALLAAQAFAAKSRVAAKLRTRKLESTPMLDFLLIALGLAFLGASIFYVIACDKL